MTASPTLPDDTRIGRIGLLVADLDTIVAFYRDTVGLDLQRRSDTRAVLGAGDTPLLVLDEEPNASPRTRNRTGLFHTAFRVPSRAALGAALERVETDHSLSGASDHGVSEAIYFDDPEGNGVEMYHDLPMESWPRAEDGTIRMWTEPLDIAAVRAATDGGSSAPTGTRLGHVHLEVSSLEASRAFYTGTLGVGVTTTVDGALFLAAGAYHHHVGLNTWYGRSAPAEGRGLAWVDIVVPEGTDVEAVTERLRTADTPVSPIERTDGRGIVFRDPDGIELRVRTPTPL